jgi:GNAT superfamily N-acetyltransferase
VKTVGAVRAGITNGILRSVSEAIPLPPERRDEVIDVLADAFGDYPLMQWVVGPGGDVSGRVRRLVAFFVSRRVMRGGPLLGVVDGNRLVGAAAITLPVEPAPPPGITALDVDVWRDLGEPARGRYQSYADTTAPFFTGLGPHYHLNMIGIRTSHKGQGLARPLLDAVRQMSDADAASTGVSLTTERDRNVKLYEHFGYGVIAHTRVSDDIQTWGLFRRITESPLSGPARPCGRR